QLPLPDNRKELVELLSFELSQDLESHKGAMERVGGDNVFPKKKEISSEKMVEVLQQDRYGNERVEAPSGGSDEESEEDYTQISETERRNDNGELEVLCDRCGGSGRIISDKTNNEITCPKCKGTGWYQPRKR